MAILHDWFLFCRPEICNDYEICKVAALCQRPEIACLPHGPPRSSRVRTVTVGQTFTSRQCETTQYIKINMVVDYCRLLLAEALYLSDMIGVESAEKIAAAARVPNLFGQASFVIIYYINLYKLI